MTERIKFTVWRGTWLRGDPYRSLLFGADGGRCCLGHLGRDCGIKDRFLDGRLSPASAREFALKWPAFILEDGLRNSADTYEAMRINDDADLTESERESKLTAFFADRGIDVEFRDGTGEEPCPAP